MNRLQPGRVLPLLLALLFLVACGEDAPEGARGAPPDGAACPAGERRLPDGRCQPAGVPPNMACPPGERVLADGSCQPAGVPPEACAAERFAPDGRGGCEAILPEEACPFGQMAVPGDKICREVSPCGEKPWDAAIPEEATTEYVDQAYPGSDSDGSREKPWTTVQAGVQAASPGAIVAVAAGRYTENVVVAAKPVRLWGLCPARTEVVGVGSQTGAITIDGERAAGTEVRRLAVTGPGTGIRVEEARSVVLEEVWVHDAKFAGVIVGARADATVRNALVEQSDIMGVFVSGSEVTVQATVVRTTQPDDAGQFGRGISIEVNQETRQVGKLRLTASLVEENHDAGVLVSGSEATVEATVVRATQTIGSGTTGVGVVVHRSPRTGQEGKLSLTASLVEENHSGGVFVIGSEATIEATVVRATQMDGSGNSGLGIKVEANPGTGEGGKLSLTASLVEENHQVGVYVIGSEATVEATVVRATQLDGAGKAGLGIVVRARPDTGTVAKLQVTASLVEENHAFGMVFFGSEARVEGTVVRATRPDRNGRYGLGISAQAELDTRERGQFSLKALLVEQNRTAGVLVTGAEGTIEDTVVRTTQPDDAGAFGDGIEVTDTLGSSRAVITATESTDNARVGVLYVGGAGELSGTRASGNRFGLVLQPGSTRAQPTLGEGNVFEGNTEQEQLVGGDLQVPDSASLLP